jgi:hypothetical protein
MQLCGGALPRDEITSAKRASKLSNIYEGLLQVYKTAMIRNEILLLKRRHQRRPAPASRYSDLHAKITFSS